MSAVLNPSSNDVVVQPWRVDAYRGSSSGRVSSEWFRRPDDQRFVSLNDLYDYVKGVHDASRTVVGGVNDIRVIAQSDQPEDLKLSVLGDRSGYHRELEVAPTHWSFGQIASLVKAPAGYLRQLPAPIAGINLQYGISQYRGEMVKVYAVDDELRAFTSPGYGRIPDFEVVAAVQKLAGNGVGDTKWKIPGVIDWRTQTYNPLAPITKQSTTLFASDRDVFLFLVDDTHPIEIGTLDDGSPDLVFRGFYVWNSEVGAKSFGLSAFYLRGVCQNRCLWGVEGYQELRFPHTSGAPDRFIREAQPALEQFTNARTDRLLAGVKEAKAAVVAKDDDDAKEFLGKQGFSKSKAQEVIDTVLKHEGRPARSVWDIVQGITRVARDVGHQDARIDLERTAGKLLDKVS